MNNIQHLLAHYPPLPPVLQTATQVSVMSYYHCSTSQALLQAVIPEAGGLGYVTGPKTLDMKLAVLSAELSGQNSGSGGYAKLAWSHQSHILKRIN